MKPTPSPNCVHCGKPHGRPLRWIFESCDACDAERDQEMIDASAGLRTASCPRCDLLFSVETQPTLTDDEREAIEFFADIHADDDPPHEYADTLRSLLERMK
jgi:NMD protein affecting ribosome stability and mRNA decay